MGLGKEGKERRRERGGETQGRGRDGRESSWVHRSTDLAVKCLSCNVGDL